MTTQRIRPFVSLIVALIVSLACGGCASAPSRVARDGSASSEARTSFVRFDNDGREYVHVYLVGEKRQWLLGRVERGASTTLRIPGVALMEDGGWARLAVLAGGRVTQRVLEEPRAVISIAQPAMHVFSERWTFSQALAGERLTSLPVGRAKTDRP